jgi:hypothetical protein
MSDVTRILSAIEKGDPSAAEQLLPLVYDELRKLAAQTIEILRSTEERSRSRAPRGVKSPFKVHLQGDVQ